MPREVVEDLEARGHKVITKDHYASVQAIHRLPNGRLVGGADPRKVGYALGEEGN